MTTLKEEEAFAVIVSEEYLNTVCSFCLASQKLVHKCKGCQKLHYCDVNCQKSDWINHKNECQLLSKAKRIPEENIRLTARILLKSEKDLGQKAFNDRTWESLTDHHKEVRDSTFYKGVDLLMTFLKPVKTINRKQACKALCKVISNSVDIYESNLGFHFVGAGVYLGLSVHKHSCIPDSQLVFNGTKAALHSLEEDTAYSNELTISYSSHEPWYPNRKREFAKNFLYECTCPLCTDKNHIMNRMGSSCRVSCCKDAAGILDENGDGPYKCNKCGAPSTLSVFQVAEAEKTVGNHTTLVSGGIPYEDMRFFAITMNIIESAELVLSAYNFKLIRILCDAHAIASTQSFHVSAKQLHDKKLVAYKYYLHQTSRHMVRCLMYRTCLKELLEEDDDFDVNMAVSGAVRMFGEQHPVIANFKKLVYEITESMKNLEIATEKEGQQKLDSVEEEANDEEIDVEKEETDDQEPLQEAAGGHDV